MPTISPSPLVYEGALSGDSRRVINQTFGQCLVGNTTVVQATNPTSAANLMTATLLPGTLSRVGQTLQIVGNGITNLTTTTSAVTIAVVLGTVTIATITTGNVAVGALNLPWQMNLLATVASIDSGGNITLETHGTLAQAITTTTAGLTVFNDVNVAVSSSIPAAGSLSLTFTALLAAGNAASFVSQRQLIATLIN